MRVALLALSPSIGMQFYAAGAANALVANGHEAWVVGAAARRTNAFDERVERIPAPLFATTGPSLSALNLAAFRALLKEIDRIHPDLVHITGPHLWNLPLALFLRRRYPLVLTSHDALAHQGARAAGLKIRYQRAIARTVSHVIVHSKQVERATRDWGIPADAISAMPLVHHNFDYALHRRIRASERYPVSYDDVALFYGRLEAYKGVRQFLDAARLLDGSQGPSVRMVIAGSGSLSDWLDRCPRPPNLELRNHLIEDEETVDLFSRVGLVVLPYSEGSQSALIPLAYLFRKPALVTRVGALPEVVRDGVTGRVIESNDPPLLARAIRDMLSDKAALAQMGEAGRQYLRELEREFADGLLRAYETMVS